MNTHQLCAILGLIWGLLMVVIKAESPSRHLNWTVSYGTASPLHDGHYTQVIMINDEFPGPTIECRTNDNIFVSVYNDLDEPLLITWNGIKQRKNSWQDGVLGTNCPIPPGQNFTYHFQTKDQIGSYSYFPSTGMQRAVGGYGALNVYARDVITVPYYPKPVSNISLLIGDWYGLKHQVLQKTLDDGHKLYEPKALLINGKHTGFTFNGNAGETHMIRVTNIGIYIHINFKIQNHKLELVEVEGCHNIPILYDSVDIYAGQSMAFLVTLDQPSNASYYIVASSTFRKNASSPVLVATGVLCYGNNNTCKEKSPSGPIPLGPNGNLHWSMNQAQSIRWNLTANAARPNPQGSYKYGTIAINTTVTLVNMAHRIDGKQRYTLNGISYKNPETPLKLADSLNISGVFKENFPTNASLAGKNYVIGTKVISTELHNAFEFVFQNYGADVESWHLDGNDFWVVGMDFGRWTNESKGGYNLYDAYTRHTVQVYPNSWTAIIVSLDNEGMWNLRSALWARQYLGQQLYVKVKNSYPNPRKPTEYPMPENVILCGLAKNGTTY